MSGKSSKFNPIIFKPTFGGIRRLIAKVYPTNLTLSSVKFITPFI
jgi:hypothetical protein